jgi:diguanylate cyclase (GGDEF)-like protein
VFRVGGINEAHTMAQHVTVPNSVAAGVAPKRSRRADVRRSTYLAQAVSYLLDSGILFLYYLAGTTTVATCLMYLAAGIAWTATTLCLSEFHFNDRFKDHYLTVPQSIGSTTIVLFSAYLAPEVGFYFVCINFIILSFGALRMSAGQTALVWTYSTVGLTFLFLMTDKFIAMPMATWNDHALALACFVTATGRCAFTGLYGSSLREVLYKRGNELRDAHARIEELAQIDELTGVLNRRYLLKALNDEIARAQRSHNACSVAIIDLDFFKSINDQFGHPVGDEVLRTFANAISANIRSIDKLGRYGGEEFLLILPGTAKDTAHQTVDRLRVIIADLDWTAISEGLGLTLSAGVCQVRQNDSADDILARIDKALYRAKEAGRNGVIAA